LIVNEWSIGVVKFEASDEFTLANVVAVVVEEILLKSVEMFVGVGEDEWSWECFIISSNFINSCFVRERALIRLNCIFIIIFFSKLRSNCLFCGNWGLIVVKSQINVVLIVVVIWWFGCWCIDYYWLCNNNLRLNNWGFCFNSRCRLISALRRSWNCWSIDRFVANNWSGNLLNTLLLISGLLLLLLISWLWLLIS